MVKNTYIDEWLQSGVLMSCGDNRLLIGWGKGRWQDHPSENPCHPSFYFPDFFLKDPTPWLIHEHTKEISIPDLLKTLESLSHSQHTYDWQSPHHTIFLEAFKELKQKFAANEMEKAVPYVMEIAKSPMTASQLTTSLISVLKYGLKNQAFLYGFWNQNEGLLGATPEILFKFIGHEKLETMACAGTKSIQGDYLSLLHDPKELNEHQFVVQGIIDSLEPFGKISVGEVKLLKLSRLVHLVTPIIVDFEKMPTFEAVVDAIHPTPAVGAFPKKIGMQWLKEYQRKIDRRRFGAPVGYVFPEEKKAACFVAIRNARWTSHEIMITAGCGVVSESLPEREWDEVNLKLRAIKEILAL